MTTSSPQAVADRLEGLRTRAVTDPSGAQDDTWAWIEQLGEARNGDELESLFSIGTVPQGPSRLRLKGQTFRNIISGER